LLELLLVRLTLVEEDESELSSEELDEDCDELELVNEIAVELLLGSVLWLELVVLDAISQPSRRSRCRTERPSGRRCCRTP
jgi:hypothetical protein